MLLTIKLKPVTEAKEVAMEAPERASSPRWPTNITEIACKLYSRTLTDIKGPASFNCFFTSPKISSLFAPFLEWETAAWEINGDSRLGFWSSPSMEIGLVPVITTRNTNHKSQPTKLKILLQNYPPPWSVFIF